MLKLYKYVVSFCPEEGALESDSKLIIVGKNQVLPQFYSKLAKKFTRIYLQHFASLEGFEFCQELRELF